MSREYIPQMTAEEAVVVLTLPLFHILTRQAFVTFPTTTTAHPSKTVLIEYSSGAPQDGSLPVHMEGNQYHKAVVPVLKDPLLDWNLPINRIDKKKYQDLIGNKIRESFEVAGY